MKKNLKNTMGIMAMVGIMGITGGVTAFANKSNNQLLEILEQDVNDNLEVPSTYLVQDKSKVQDGIIFDTSDYINSNNTNDYSKYLIQSLYNLSDIKQDFYASYTNQGDGYFTSNDTITTIFDDNNNFIACDIDAENLKVYSITSLVPNSQLAVDMQAISSETKDYLANQAVNILNTMGLSISNKQLDYYNTGKNQETISVGFQDDFGNYEFVEFSYSDYTFIGYTYCEHGSKALENLLNNLNNRDEISIQTTTTDKEQLEQIIIDDNLEVPEGYELVEVIQG